MKIGHQKLSEYDKRIKRAEHLAAEYSFSAKPLKFYVQIAQFQKELANGIPENWGWQPVVPPGKRVRAELNLVLLLPHFPAFLTVVKQNAPGPLSAAAESFARENSPRWIAALADYWALGGREAQTGDTAKEFFCRAFLQPYAELAGKAMAEPAMDGTPYVCPKCDSLPLLGVLRPEGDGGKRFLRCAFCAHEWTFRRILCPACGEEREEKLPVFVAEQFPHIRVEGCDTCRHYLRTIDLTKDGNAVAEADDLAAIPLTLWAQEHGYIRIHANLLGA